MELTQGNNLTQLDKALQTLDSMAVNITDDDRKSAQSSLNLTYQTIWRYFRGEGKNLDTAMTLIKFFKRRIEEREKLIGQ